MANTKYKLRYLPLFYKDLEEKIVYIAEELHNEKAANDFILSILIIKSRITSYNQPRKENFSLDGQK